MDPKASSGRRWRRWTTVALIALVLSPLITGVDSVPLSRYRMYAEPRSATIDFVVARGLTAEGADVHLSTATIADTTDPLIAESWLRTVVAQGRASEACAEIAGRIGDGQPTQIRSVELRVEAHDLRARAQADDSLLTSRVVASCER